MQSTFRRGKIENRKIGVFRTAAIMQRAVEDIAYVCRTRKMSRSLEVSQELERERLNRKQGFLIKNVQCHSKPCKNNGNRSWPASFTQDPETTARLFVD